ncbi:hypothetical protein AB1286_20145 [Trinickia sp. NRRL B-1857]|uniref:terminase small subunit-like protein n=1 Tax=Trinickia sp. NRRL B-1857 TaxID=3162879 RepID=UPI003D2CC3F7
MTTASKTAKRKAPAKKVYFSQGLFDRICALLADGKSVRGVCKGARMPDRVTFLGWTHRTPELRQQYEEACAAGEDAICDDIQYIADTVRDAKRAAVQIDARKWKLKIMNRRKYGDHVRNEHSGPNGGPIETKQQIVRLRMTPVEELPE